MAQKKLSFRNPIIAAQTFDVSFVADPYQGHTMPKGREFIGESEYISIENLTTEIHKTKKKIVLNIGDSSTSGWDSNIVTQNRDRFSKGLPLLPAFFQYKTYSDYLRDLIGDEYIVINAGVPAHTSLQGSRRLKFLLNHFKKENLPIEWITIYYGNNDSVWDHNRQDKEWVGRNSFISADNLLRFLRKKSDSSIVTRVQAEDYKVYMKEILKICDGHKIKTIVIEPITPIYWKPGTRVLDEELERKHYPGSTKVYEYLDSGRELWAHAVIENGYSNLKRAALEEVREKDYVVPRIKRAHLTNLRILVEEMNVPYVCLDIDRTENDIRYFIDYCHPIGDANKLLAQHIIEIISGKKSGKGYNFNNPFTKTPMEEIKVLPELPTDHYTLY